MRAGWWLTGVAALATVAVHAQAQTPAPSRQQLYNDAQAAYDRGDWAQAVSGFERALDGLTASRSRSAGVIRTRLAAALLKVGRVEEAHRAARAAVETLAGAAGPDLELADANITLAEAARFDLAYPEAIRAYQEAMARTPQENAATVRPASQIGIMLAAATFDPELAARSGDALIGNTAYFDALPKAKRAEWMAVRARIELNRGNAKGALPFIAKAMNLHGPLDTKVSLTDVAIRGDAALVYERTGDMDRTRELLTYTGAGHLPSSDWIGSDMELPVCGPDVRPEDTAIVQFAIADDGGTVGVAPIYVSRGGEMGTVFAEAVRGWRWRPSAVAKLDGFWRSSIRLQLRCVTRPEPVSLHEPFRDAANAWLTSLGATPADDKDDGALLALKATLLAELQKAMAALGEANPMNWAGRFADVDRELVRLRAPTDARAYVAFFTARGSPGSLKAQAASRARLLGIALPLIEAMPNPARAAAWLRTEYAINLETAGRFDEARPSLEAVEALPATALPEEDPIRKVAILYLSLLDRRGGSAAAAEGRLARAGITADQCSLYDVKPVPANASISSSEFPTEALRWSFDGYVREAFDIAPDGSVKGVRTVIAYPPFIFAQATEKAVGRFRYLPPTMGGVVLGCANQTQSVRYSIPR